MKKLFYLILFFLLLSGTALAGGTIQWPTACFFDSNGDPLSGGKLYSYVAGTSTAKVLYSDRAATTSHTNPEILDSNGCTEIYGIGTYKLILKDSADSTTYFTDDNVTVSAQSVSYYYPNYNAADQGATGNSDTIKYAVDTCSSDNCTIVLQHNSGSATTTYTLSSSESIPENISFKIEIGAILTDDASNATLNILGPFPDVEYKVFDFTNGTGTVKWATRSGADFTAVPKISWVRPQWWGGTGDNSTNDTVAMEAAIVAGNQAKVKILLSPGTYRAVPGELSTIECGIDGPGADIKAHDSTDSVLLDLDYEVNNSTLKLRTVLGYDVATHYVYSALDTATTSGIGIRLRGGLYSHITVGRIVGFDAGISIPGALDDEQISDNSFDIGELRANDYHVLATAGDGVNTETNTFRIGYLYDGRIAAISLTAAGTGKMQSNIFHIESLETQKTAGDHGIIVDGTLTRRNLFFTAATIYNASGFMVYGQNGANFNYFKLATWDEDRISVNAYNVFDSHTVDISEQTSGDQAGRSMVRSDAQPSAAAVYYGDGDIALNSSPSDGILLWHNTGDSLGGATRWGKTWSRPDELITGAGACATVGITRVNTSGTIAITLADPTDAANYGLIKEFIMIVDGGTATLTVASHESDTNEVFEIDTVYDYIRFLWNGNVWVTDQNKGVTVP